MSPPPVRLRMAAWTTTLELHGGRTITLAVGPRGLAESVLRHDPPTPAELEQAIDLVEDALTGLPIALADGAWLVSADALLLALPGLDAQGPGLARDAVEALFQRLASRSLGTPVAAADLPEGREGAAALLILRECMHHLDLGRIGVAAA